MSISQTILDEIRKHAEKEKTKEGKLPYWLECPSCGRRVVRKQLLSKGCYLCGWHEARDEVELAKIMRDRNNTEETTTSYRTNCPQCKARVITQELMERGCYRCGWKPEA